MLEQLFNSKTRVAILALFFANENKKFYGQEIIKLAKVDPANSHRELIKLNKLGFLKSERVANQKYYFLDKNSEYYEGLKMIFDVYNYRQEEGKWMLYEEMPNYYPMVVADATNVKRANDFLKTIGIKNRFSKTLAIYDNGFASIWFPQNEFYRISREVVEKLVKNPVWGEIYNREVIKRSEEVFGKVKKLSLINLASLSNKKLYKLFVEHFSLLEYAHILHWFVSALDYGENLFSKYLMNYIKNRIKNSKYSLGDAFAILTTPTEESMTIKEYKSLLEILDYILQKNKLKNYFKKTETKILAERLKDVDRKLNTELDKHTKNYGWLGYGTVGPNWGKEYFINILSSLIRQKARPAKLLKKVEIDRNGLIQKQQELIKGLKIEPLHQKVFEVARGLIFGKGLRKDKTIFFYLSATENLFREIGRRYFLSLQQVRFLYPHEVKDLLLRNKFSAAVLNERYKFSVYYSIGEGEKDVLLEGEKAKKFLKSFNFTQEKTEDIKLLQGDCAGPGRVRGEVAIINTVQDMEKMRKGMILVSTATSPDLVPAIKKAAAIITDAGGITCHAAIISRELGIPCVTGTKIATRALKDNDLVEVDATHGKVIIIKKMK